MVSSWGGGSTHTLWIWRWGSGFRKKHETWQKCSHVEREILLVKSLRASSLGARFTITWVINLFTFQNFTCTGSLRFLIFRTSLGAPQSFFTYLEFFGRNWAIILNNLLLTRSNYPSSEVRYFTIFRGIWIEILWKASTIEIEFSSVENW